MRFILNNSEVSASYPTGTALLEILRNSFKLVGTKEGCGEGDCGVCAVLLGELNNNNIKYVAVNSCLTPLGQIAGKHVVTIEGLNKKEPTLIQSIFCKEFAAQCGFCTPGFIISLTGFLLNASRLDEDDAVAAIAGNICRCTGYASIRRSLSGLLATLDKKEFEKTKGFSRINLLIKKNILPNYFKIVSSLLKKFDEKQNFSEGVGIGRKLCVAGATDLMVQKRVEMEMADLNFLFSKKAAKAIEEIGGKCFISATATVEQIRNSGVMKKIFPEIKNTLSMVASAPIRNRATIAGNFANASPIGDLTILFLALDSVLILSDGHKKREVKLRNFYGGYKKLNKKDNEIIETVYFNIPKKNYLISFEKVSKRKYLDIASVNSAMAIKVAKDKITHIQISAGGVGPTPLCLIKTSKFLKGKKLSAENIRQAVQIINKEILPISDIRGSKLYKKILLGRLVCAHFIKLFPKKFGKNIL